MAAFQPIRWLPPVALAILSRYCAAFHISRHFQTLLSLQFLVRKPDDSFDYFRRIRNCLARLLPCDLPVAIARMPPPPPRSSSSCSSSAVS